MPSNIKNQWESLGFVPMNNSSNNKWESLGFVPSDNGNKTSSSSDLHNQVDGEESLLNDVGRKLGVYGRGLASGTAVLIDSAAALGNSAYTRESIENDEQQPIDPRTQEIDKNSLAKKVNEWFGTNFEPDTAFEKFVHLLGALNVPLGGIAKTGNFLKTAGKHILRDVAPAAGIVGAEEAGIENPALQVLAGTAADLASKTRPSHVKAALAKVSGFSPKNIDLKIVDALERQGLEPNIALVNKSKNITGLEKTVQEIPIVGENHTKTLKNFDDNYLKKVEETLENTGERVSLANDPGAVTNEVGSYTQNSLKEALTKAKEENYALYEKANQLLPTEATIIPENTLKAVEEIKSKIKTLKPSADEAFVLSYLDSIENGLTNNSSFGKLNYPVPIEMVIGTKRSLNDIINWDVKATGARNSLKKVQGAIQADLEAAGKKYPEWYKAQKEGDVNFGLYQGDKALGSDIVRKILAEENPEKILPYLNKSADFKYLETSLSRLEGGKNIFESIKREKLESLIMGKVVNPEGNITYAPFRKLMNNSQQSNIIKYLIGEGQFNKLRDFSTIASAQVAKEARNSNKSGTAYKLLVWSPVVNGLHSLLSGEDIVQSLKDTTKWGVIGLGLSKIFKSRKVLNYSINAARAARKNESVQAKKWADLANKTAEEEMGKDLYKQFTILNSRNEQLSEKNK